MKPQEVVRENMPTGVITYTTVASQSAGGEKAKLHCWLHKLLNELEETIDR